MRVQTRTVLSLEEERIMFGSSGVVAMEVTHPECPERVPLSESCSDMIREIDYLGGGGGSSC